MTEEEYWFWLCNIENIYPLTLAKLLSVFSCPGEIWEAGEREITARSGLRPELSAEIAKSKSESGVKRKLEKLRDGGTEFIYPDHPSYPEALRFLNDIPYSLYVRGSLPAPCSPRAGMVGSRNCTGYGRKWARKLAKAFVSAGAVTVSGMALGIDSESARATIEYGGKTFAVLGSGIDVIYPRENIGLYYDIINSGGGIITEFPPKSAPLPWQFPRRNRIIAALSDILVVVEAGLQSGSLTTAEHMLNLGGDVWALPGRADDPMSEGCNRLIADGAGIITDEAGCTGALKRARAGFCADSPKSDMSKAEREAGRALRRGTDTAEQSANGLPREIIFRLIDYNPVNTGCIINNSGMKADEVTEILSDLELDDLIVHLPGDYYARK